MRTEEVQPEFLSELGYPKEHGAIGLLMLASILVAAFCIGFFFGWRRGISDGRDLVRGSNRFGELRD